MRVKYAQALIAFAETVQRFRDMHRALHPPTPGLLPLPGIEEMEPEELIYYWHKYTVELQGSPAAMDIISALKEAAKNKQKENQK